MILLRLFSLVFFKSESYQQRIIYESKYGTLTSCEISYTRRTKYYKTEQLKWCCQFAKI
jgi:hypothetical protein